MNWKQKLRGLMRRGLGLDLTRFNPEADLARRHYPAHPRVRLARFLKQQDVQLVLDVGANTGQYGRRLRQLGFSGRLISFEPSREAYEHLKKRVADDPNWSAYPFALGDRRTELSLNLAANSQSSSLLPILDRHLDAAPGANTVGQEVVPVHALDDLFPELCPKSSRGVLLKLDVQGFEPQVLQGATRALENISCLQVEMSLKPLYESEIDFTAMVQDLEERGYFLHALENGFTDPRGQLLQVDGLFLKAP